MWKLIKIGLVLAGMVAVTQVPGVRPLVVQAGGMVASFVSRPAAAETPSGATIRSELAEIESRLTRIKSESDELAATARRSEAEANRLGEVLSKTTRDVVVIQADGQASVTEFRREDLQLEQAVFVVAGSAAKMQQAALAEEAESLRNRQRQLEKALRRETATAVANLLDQMPRVAGKSLAGDKE